MTAVVAPPDVPDLLGTSPADLIDRVTDQPVATLDEARQRAGRLRAGLVRYSEMRQDIADAYACKDWLALDYGSWYQYVKGEFGEELRQLSRTERSAAVRDLRTQGMSTRQIASVTGAPKSTVADAVKQLPESGQLPERIIGLDGKERPASRPSTSAGQDLPPESETSWQPSKPGETPGQMDPEAKPERPKPPKWDPEERRQHEDEVRRVQIIDAARRESKTIVTTVLAAVTTVVGGSRLGDRGLITRAMVNQLREAIDLLEGEIDDEK